MPSIISHAVVGISVAAASAPPRISPKVWVLSAVLALLPDADVIGFRFGISYSHLLGHRGFFHSLFFACMLGTVAASLFFREEPVFSGKWFLLAAYFSLIAASHG